MNHLIHFPPRSRVRIDKIEAEPEVAQKLAHMGILPNVTVEILHTSKTNALIVVKRHNRRIVLRCNAALSILATLL